jgi:hypothetical protein
MSIVGEMIGHGMAGDGTKNALTEYELTIQQ